MLSQSVRCIRELHTLVDQARLFVLLHAAHQLLTERQHTYQRATHKTLPSA